MGGFGMFGSYKIYTAILFVGLFVFVCPVKMRGQIAERDFYFFSDDEKKDMKQSATMEWGKRVLDSLRLVVEERLRHPLEVPMLEGGHLHQYCCPVHNVTFTFNWDKPTSHYCPVCKKEWNDKNAYNWAWVNWVHAHNLDYLNACMYLYLATDERKYAEYIRDMLLDYARKYPTYMVHNSNREPSEAHSGKMFAQSLDEAVWATDAARAYDVAKPVITLEEQRFIEKGYLRECANLLLRRKDGGNWQAWHNSGLAALGVALHDDAILDVVLNDEKYGYKALMKKHVYPDGWWNEGSPTYHFYPLRAILLTAEAFQCRKVDLFDDHLRKMFVSPILGTYRDLTFPAHNDGWYGESLLAQVKLYELAYHYYKDSLLLNTLADCYTRTERVNPEALINPIEIKSLFSTVTLKSCTFDNLGVTLLKSGTNTVVLKHGSHGGGHGHPDKLSISIHNGKREILSDLGTCAYGVPDYTKWYRKTLGHNTVVVDGKDQLASDASLVQFKPSSKGGTVVAEANDVYAGVMMKRKVSLKDNLVEDVFTCASDSEHVYDYVLLLNDKPVLNSHGIPTMLDDSEAYLQVKNVKRYKTTDAFSFKVGKDCVEIKSATFFDVFIGEASGIPPTNPGVKTKEGTEKRSVLPCYPLIVRTTAKRLDLKMNWLILSD